MKGIFHNAVYDVMEDSSECFSGIVKCVIKLNPHHLRLSEVKHDLGR